MKRNHSEIEDWGSDADVEGHINDEILTIPDAIAAIHVINKFFPMQTVEERELESFDLSDKKNCNLLLK